MSSAHTPTESILVDLARKFEAAAEEFPGVDAIVVFRPDLRDEDLLRQARNHLAALPDAAVDTAGAEEADRTNRERTAWRLAAEWAEFIPPAGRLVNDHTGQVYQGYGVRNFDARPFEWLWQCFLVGTPVPFGPNIPARRFERLALDAVRDVLGGVGSGNSPASSWLIHLADRMEPLRPAGWRRPRSLVVDQRKTLEMRWSKLLGKFSPSWPSASQPAEEGSRVLAPWWAARLANVFGLSELAIRHEIETRNDTSSTRKADPASRAKGSESVKSKGGRPTNQQKAAEESEDGAFLRRQEAIVDRLIREAGPNRRWSAALARLKQDRQFVTAATEAYVSLDESIIDRARRKRSGAAQTS